MRLSPSSQTSFTMPHQFSRALLAIAFFASPLTKLPAQATPTAKTTPVVFDADSARLAELPWRSIGPAVTSGRVVDFAVPEGPKSQIGERLGELSTSRPLQAGCGKRSTAGLHGNRSSIIRAPGRSGI